MTSARTLTTRINRGFFGYRERFDGEALEAERLLLELAGVPITGIHGRGWKKYEIMPPGDWETADMVGIDGFGSTQLFGQAYTAVRRGPLLVLVSLDALQHPAEIEYDLVYRTARQTQIEADGRGSSSLSFDDARVRLGIYPYGSLRITRVMNTAVYHPLSGGLKYPTSQPYGRDRTDSLRVITGALQRARADFPDRFHVKVDSPFISPGA